MAGPGRRRSAGRGNPIPARRADRSAPRPAAALLISGALIADAWWDAAALRDTGAAPEKLDSDDRPKRGSDLPLNVPVFQSHGTEDTILPIEEGRALTERLAERGYPVTTVEFHDGHTIPAVAVEKARQFLLERTSSL